MVCFMCVESCHFIVPFAASVRFALAAPLGECGVCKVGTLACKGINLSIAMLLQAMDHWVD